MASATLCSLGTSFNILPVIASMAILWEMAEEHHNLSILFFLDKIWA